MQYVSDTLLLVKEKDINLIHECLSSFDKNIKFTIDLQFTMAPKNSMDKSFIPSS